MSGRYPDFIKIAENAQVDFVIADPHLGHDDILRYTERRELFRDIDEMDDYIIETWNSIVGRKDYIWIVGDFAFKNHQRYLNALNGKKVLILGNHDKMATSILERLTGVYPFHVRTVNGQTVTFHHFPMMSWPDAYEGSWHLYGHVHGRAPEFAEKARMDVGWDVWWQPIPWKIIVTKMRLKAERSLNMVYRDTRDDKTNAFDLAKKNLQIIQKYDTIPKTNRQVLTHFGLVENDASAANPKKANYET